MKVKVRLIVGTSADLLVLGLTLKLWLHSLVLRICLMLASVSAVCCCPLSDVVITVLCSLSVIRDHLFCVCC